MSGTSEVSPEQLHGHAGTVSGLAGQVQGAADAAGHVAALDDAYGLLCMQLGLPLMLKMPQEEAASTIGECAKAFQKIAESLKISADEYQRIDDEHARNIQQIKDELRAP